MLIDPFGRPVTYLRISVTDRCNFRCVYCMPPEGVAWQLHENILRYEEIMEVVRVAAEHGVREFRLTGGEPLVRKDLKDLVRMMAETPGVEDISLTTNGLLLENQIEGLAEAGLRRINVSLDTLDPQKFARITRGGSFEKVMRGLEKAEAVGIQPIKINVVMMRGVNDDELVSLARLSIKRPWHVRFIEIMPVNNQQPWGEGFPNPAEAYFSIKEVMNLLEPYHLVPENTRIGNGPAREYRLDGALGRIGFISPVGEQFCDRCNRLRLTADGNLRPCLLTDVEIPLAQALRRGEPIWQLIQEAVLLKPSGHDLNGQAHPYQRCMIQIGG
jgi:GTP 3',8-cyclase